MRKLRKIFRKNDVPTKDTIDRIVNGLDKKHRWLDQVIGIGNI